MATYEVLTSSQRRQLENVVQDFTPEDIARYYTFSANDLQVIRRRKRKTRFGFAIQLCYLRFPGRPLADEETIPDALLVYIGQQLDLPTSLMNDYGQRREQTLDDHLQALQQAFGFSRFVDERQLAEWLLPTAIDTEDGWLLMTILMDGMRKRQIIQPKLSRLEALVWQVREDANQTLYHRLTDGLTDQQRTQLKGLFDLRTELPKVTYLVWLREPPEQAKPINFKRVAERREHIRKIGLPPELAQAIPPHRLQKLARDGDRSTPQHLSTLTDELEMLSTLVAFLLDKTVTLTDLALQMNDQLVGDMFNTSEKQQNRKMQRNTKKINHIVFVHDKVGQAIIRARIAGEDPYHALEAVITWSEYVSSVEDARNITQGKEFNVLDVVVQRYSKMRRYSPKLLQDFEFNGTEATRGLREAMALLQKRNQVEKPGPLPKDVPADFVKPDWQPYVFPEDGTVDHRYYELCVLTELRSGLRSGDVTMKNSRWFKDFEEYFIPAALWQQMKDTNTVPLPINLDYTTYIKERKQQVEEEMATVEHLMARGELPEVTLKEGKLSFTRPQEYEHANAAAKLSDDLYELLPRIRIPQLLAEVDGWTGFSRCFTHQRSGELVDNPSLLYAVILAEAINLGVEKMAESSPSLKAESLLSAANAFLREETYGNGLIELVNYHHRLPFANYWGDGTTSASDGQFFQADKRTALADINKHYGFHPGVMFITHESDQYGSYKITAISPNEHQAPSMLDGLFHHHTDLKIREHYSDTGGYTQHVFAIMHLAGLGYAPRIRDLNEKRLHCFDNGANYPTLAPWIGDKVNIKRPERHWDEILRLEASLITGVAKPSLVLKRLSAFERKNNLSSAIQDIGQIEQTLYMLTWFQDPVLRYRVFGGMQKVERKHTMARALCIYRHGIIKDLTLEALLNRASGLNFLIMAIVIWNTVYLAHAVEALRSRGIEVPDHLLQHISPLAWDHINLIGDYTWDKLLLPSNMMRSLREDKIAKLLKRKTGW